MYFGKEYRHTVKIFRKIDPKILSWAIVKIFFSQPDIPLCFYLSPPESNLWIWDECQNCFSLYRRWI